MRKSKLPLPVLILILATLFLLSSTLGERIGRPSSALRAPASETVEQQQAAILYLRVMSWLSRVITRPIARAEDKVESAQPGQLIKAPTHRAAHGRVQLCALKRPSHPLTSFRNSSQQQFTIHRPRLPLAGFFQRTTDY